MIRVLFVCLANVCRSPMAEAVFAQMVTDANLQNFIETDSAGTADWEMDSAPHPGTLDILEQHGIAYFGQSRALKKTDLEEFGYILTMDDSNLRAVHKLGKGKAIVAPLLSFVADTDLREIPDPYFDNGFELVYQMVFAGAQGLLEYIIESHQLSISH